jgi:hypothetical protein
MLEGPPVPVHNLQPSVPAPLSRIVERLLQRDPEKRFTSATELGEALSKVS